MNLRTTNRKISILLILFSTLYLTLSFQLPKFPYAIVDSDILPKGLGFLLLVLSIGLFFDKNEKKKEGKQAAKKEKTLLVGIVGMILLYIFLLEIVGFVLTTVAFLFAMTRLLGYENWKVNGLVALSFSFVIYLSFNYLLNIYLPQGILPF
ncbi:tripartite tricarboxylate transporter TctB family protein [Bacillus kexueae]|uniref:tripartite tricarboxylate transporter TctB family protein n=1 Tax=Aeribacillus kexueae TaxID=2078952 RepID=UPI001FAF2D5E|nr:tripartite tricarboxylate transporter TctB family protein [Bacillus kexueae]